VNQPRSVREQLNTLEQLQELDLRIDELKKQKSTLPVAMKNVETEYIKTKASADTKQNELNELDKTFRQTQAAIELNKDRLTRANQKLEGVQNSQEFQAASKEIEQLKKLNLSLEEQLKKSTEEMTQGNELLKKLQDQFDKINNERDAQLEAISGQAGKLDGAIGELTKERDVFLSQLDRPLVAKYDRIRAARGGLGIVPASGGRCSGCNMMVPPQLFNEIQRYNNIQNCPSCHRLLYVSTPKENKQEQPPAEAVK